MPRKIATTHMAPRNTKSGKSPGRKSNSEYRSREHLKPDEVESLIDAAKRSGRHGHRDATAILVAYRHGLRASELCELRRADVDLNQGEVHVRRLKNGKPATHPLDGEELRALRRLFRETESSHVFATERGSPMDRSGFLKIVRRAGEMARLPFPVHPHMLRHAAGYYLANRGVDTRTIQDYLGHRAIQHTVRYTELAPGRFKGLWSSR